MSLAFVTVTFWGDFDLLEQQLSSMDRYISVSYVHYIVLNDIDKHLPALEKLVYSHTHHRYKIITRSQLQARYPLIVEKDKGPNGPHIRIGWHTQQVLKLAIAKELETDFYCLLDSKDYFQSTVDPVTEFFINDRPIGLLESPGIADEFTAFRQNSYKVFNQPDSEDLCLRSHTPFVMKTSYVLGMLEYLIAHNKSLIRLIEGDGTVTPVKYPGNRCVEFYLYSAWLKLNQFTDQYHWIKDPTFVNPNIKFDLPDYSLPRINRRQTPRLKIVVCGCSFSCPVSGELTGTHWSELLAKETNAELIVLAQPGATNNDIRLQISEAIQLNPDLVIINSTTPDPGELPTDLEPMKQQDRWIINSGLWELLNNNIAFLYNQWLTGDLDLPQNIRERYTVPSGLDFNVLRHRFSADSEYHTTIEGQKFIATQYYIILRARELI